MNKFAIGLSLAAGLVLQSTVQAGQSVTATVGVYSSSDGATASGAVSAARQSADNVQSIGCDIASDGVSSSFISCFASDVAGKEAYCSISSPSAAALSALSSVNASSVIYFQANSSGVCTYLSIDDDSVYL
jgi:hypothetical protein